jgi:hypothetical protein
LKFRCLKRVVQYLALWIIAILSLGHVNLSGHRDSSDFNPEIRDQRDSLRGQNRGEKHESENLVDLEKF